MKLCPCGSGDPFEKCCEAIIIGTKTAPTAKALMQSRYTAFTLANAEYLMKSWAIETRNINEKEEIRRWAKSVRWVKLKILDTDAGLENDLTGYVTFQAFFRDKGKLDQIQEKSYFEKREGSWVYISGTHQ